MDQLLFQNLCREYSEREIEKKEKNPDGSPYTGIGTLSEKTIHAVLKDYMDSNPAHQEQPLKGYVADIFDGSAVVEIQTRSFNRLRDKLSSFLPDYPVTVVHPIPAVKFLNWIDPETGEILSRRKSPKKGNPYDAIKELYRLKMFLNDINLHFHFIFLDVEEYRLQDGYARDKKKGSTRIERIPSCISSEFVLDKPADYRLFIPDGLPVPFTSKDFKSAAHITQSLACTTLNILSGIGVIERIGKKGRLYEYRIAPDSVGSFAPEPNGASL